MLNKFKVKIIISIRVFLYYIGIPKSIHRYDTSIRYIDTIHRYDIPKFPEVFYITFLK